MSNGIGDVRSVMATSQGYNRAGGNGAEPASFKPGKGFGNGRPTGRMDEPRPDPSPSRFNGGVRAGK